MASRLLAKKYLRTFRELATRDAQRVARRSWFGRLLWKLFGRWL